MIRLRRIALSCLAAFALSSGLACSEHPFVTCDITQRACQEDVYYRVLSLRGDGYDPFGGLPPVTVISEADFRAMLVAEQAASAQEGKNPWDQALVLLHFTTTTKATGNAGVDGGASGDAGAATSTATSTIDDEVAHIYAFYDQTSRTITIISHPNQTGDHVQEEAMITLAHELVHALQDREIDLNKSDFNSED